MNFNRKGVRKLLGRYFNLLADKEDERAVVEQVKSGIAFRGTNLWILIFAILIASLGLNVNSTAVIIGAMLISPLMGPIIGMGFSVGVSDMEMLKQSLKNYGVATLISVVTATFYFWLSPLSDAQSELLARTSPTLYDVLIAFCGGAAGVLALTTKSKGQVIPGVAIATALMPPLCTVGFGIACLKPAYIFGAAYLFLINSFFIALSTFLVTKFLGFKSAASDEIQNRRNSHIAATFVILMLIPSIITAIGTIRDNNFTTNAERFIQNNKTIGATYIFDHDINLKGRNQTLDIYLAGEALDYTAKQVLLKNALSYGLHSDQIIFHEEAAVQTINKNELIRDLNEHYLKTIQDLNQTITELQVELARYKGAEKAAEKAAADSAKTKQ